MRLEELLRYRSIVILCHDDPDADAVASGYGLYQYFGKQGKEVRLVYGGESAIQKRNLVLLVETYQIPIEYVTELEEPDLLITVDCQYGQGNVHPFTGKAVAVIDHHQVRPSQKLPALQEIRSNYGSCSTLVWRMLTEAGYDVGRDLGLSTALYYGLYMDTSKLQEISHPMDKDMRDILSVDKSTLTLLQNSNLSLEELEIASRALANVDYYEPYRFAISEAETCDPNILGIISDMLLEVDAIDACVVYCMRSDGAKISVRSCVKEVRADELSGFLAAGIGSSGGHLRKAGGFLDEEMMARVCGRMSLPATGSQVHDLIKERMEQYFSEAEIIDAASYQTELSGMDLYQKKQVPIGYVKAEDLFPVGTQIMVRMLEGDFEITVSEGIFIMIGVDHEIYPTDEAYFLERYAQSDEPYLFEGEYSPTVHDTLAGECRPLLPHARSCVAKKDAYIYVKELSGRTKVFTKWDKDRYMLGVAGDYLAASKEDANDLYIIKKEVFSKIYQKV